MALRNEERYEEAVAAFEALGDYGDAEAQILATYTAQCDALLAAQDWSGAATAYENAGNPEQAKDALYQQANTLKDEGNYADAYTLYATLTGYKDVDNIIQNDDNIAAAAAAAAAAARGVSRAVHGGQYRHVRRVRAG